MTLTPTSHDRVLELLPWLINGTLADVERREVEEHLAACEACRAELAATRQAFEIYAAHLPPRVLTAYVETAPGDALAVDGTAVDRALLEEHLAACDTCREELEMVRAARAAMEEEETAAGRPPAGVTPWRPASPPPGSGTPANDTPANDTGWRSLALAASLLLTVLAVGWFFTNRQLAGTERQLAEVRQELQAVRGDAPPATASAQGEDPDAAPPGDTSPSAAELAAARDRVAELEQAVGEYEAQVASLGERVDTLADAARPRALPALYAVPAQLSGGEVMRGGGDAPAAALPELPLGAAVYLAPPVPAGRLASLEKVGYRFLGPDGEDVESGELPVFQDPEAGPLVTFSWPTAGRPAGTYTLVLTTPEGLEIGRYAFALAD
jgi:anti-sigma factor RsiW